LAHVAGAWRALRRIPQPPMVASRLDAALGSMSRAIGAKRSLRVRQAAIDVLQSTFDLELRHRSATAVDEERLVLWTRQLLVDAAAGNRDGVAGDVATLEWIRDRITGAFDGAGRGEIDTRLRALRAAADAGNLAAAADHAARLAARVRTLASK